MKLVWSPETASKAYIDTIKSNGGLAKKSSVAEMLSAMAGGWNAKLIVEAWFKGGEIATSIGLTMAARHTGGRHVCIVSNERSRLAYLDAMQNSGVSSPPEMMIGDAKGVMEQLEGVDFLVVDSRHKDFTRVFKLAKLNHLGAVLVLKNATISGFRWDEVVDSVRRVVRSVILPVGNGVEIAYVASSDGKDMCSRRRGSKGWITKIDRRSGEEHVFRG